MKAEFEVDAYVEQIEQFERQKKFNENLNPVDWNNALPVDGDFPYIPKGFKKIKYFFLKLFIIRPFTRRQAKRVFRVKIEGRENLKGVRSAVVTSNHIAIFDCLVNRYALGRSTKTVAAGFNNRKGCFGEWMRAGGMLPLGSGLGATRQFNRAVAYYLARENYILFYPEQAMWPMYEKPRPFLPGAFFYAVKNNVPVVPMFTTIRQEKYFTVHIGKPVAPKADLSQKENIQYLKDAAFAYCVGVYEKEYGKKLEYLQESE